MQNNKKEILIYQGNIINHSNGYEYQEDMAQGIFEEMVKALNKLYSKVEDSSYLDFLEYGIDKETEQSWIWFITDNKENFELVYHKNTGKIYLKGDLKTICIDGCIYKDPSNINNQ